MTTQTPSAGSIGAGEFELRQQGRIERALGPEAYRILKGLVTNPLSIVGLLLIALFILVGTFAYVIAPPPTANWDRTLIPRDGFRADPKPPGTEWARNAPETMPFWYKPLTGNDSWVHVWGTTSGQYDIFYGVIWGTRTALVIGGLVVASSAAIGITVGAIAGFYGGWVDEVLMRVVEIFIVFPFLIAAMILASILIPVMGRSIWPSSIALIVFGWTGYARLLRGDILATKERDYVMAARASGASDIRLIMRHVLPNAIFPTLVVLSLDMGSIVLSFAALSFLGIGVQEGYADWGQIVSRARDWIPTLQTHWYIVVYPGLALLLYGLSWNLVGDALRDILDPKLRGK
ncbi:MAG: ABC transporter permease [Anaerolineales bacterium]|nr:ABC transporter permease [Anaerolineales bacterium]MCB0010382.1 ABC transporter permease [Anaerolineales bacterium]MCB0016402.1 ABC transporter permease [Anaerolineales bacterium]MCB0026958.1 ABC transporter permease [Anaerolineales bacterium]MCB8961489.1 ABC transporter permease [Ardenticatenales bacterium]